MKKKIVSMFLATAMIICLSSCGVRETIKDGIAPESSTGSLETTDNRTSETVPEASANEDTSVSEVTEAENRIVLWAPEIDKVVYLDEAGKASQIINIIEDGEDETDESTGEYSYGSGNLINAYNNYLIFKKYFTKGSEYGYVVYARDINTGDRTDLLRTHGNVKSDIYDGTLYISSYDYNAKTLLEVGYSIDSLKETSRNEIQGYDFVGSKMGHFDYYNYAASKRLLDEYGFVLVREGGSYGAAGLAKFDGKTLETVPHSDDINDIIAYDNNGFVASVYDRETYKIHIVRCDYEGNSVEACSEYGSGSFVVGYRDGKLYYCIMDRNYGVEEYTIREYDMESGKEKDVYSAKKQPGMSRVTPGVSGFTINNDDIYYLSADDGEVCWYKAAKQGPDTAGKKIADAAVIFADWKKYGTVEYINKVLICPGCDIATGKFYQEFFVVDESISPAADVINDKLFDIATNGEAIFDNGAYDELVDPGLCSDHEAGWLVSEQSVNVNSVELFGDKYLQIHTSGDWYGGGAHGMPSMTTFIFDLTTGDLVLLKDLYSGTEDELKNLIADKAVESAKESIEKDGASYFYSDDLDEIRREVLENAYLDSYNVFFNENGATYYFDPYVVGPYASGFIEIFISYEELGFRFE
ncbi:MAG: RsiV family protein [Lachnospiraceae bacterium]|nr:RsiV family protein [Lachnospiraceae bacterium]